MASRSEAGLSAALGRTIGHYGVAEDQQQLRKVRLHLAYSQTDSYQRSWRGSMPVSRHPCKLEYIAL